MGQVCGMPDGEAQMQKDRELVFEQVETQEVPEDRGTQGEPEPEDRGTQGEPEPEVPEQPEQAVSSRSTGTEIKDALDRVARRTGYECAQGSSDHKAIPKRAGVAAIIERETGRTVPKEGFDFGEEEEGDDVKWKSGHEEVDRQDGDSVADDAEEQLAEVVHYAYVDKEVDREQAEEAGITEEEIEKLRWQAEQQVMLERAKKDAEHDRQIAAADAAFDEA